MRMDEDGQLKTVHSTRHPDVREQKLDIIRALHDRNGFIGILRLKNAKAGIREHFGTNHLDQSFVLHHEDRCSVRMIQ